MATIDIGYRPRAQFVPFHRRKQRFACIVAHRRAGKTVACINDIGDAALRETKPNGRFAYIAPFYRQAKDVAWQYLKDFAAPLIAHGARANESELRIDLPNGARVRLYGADNYEALRGIYLDDVILDEYADMDPRAWSEVIRPALSDREGGAVFIGTPKGRNAFHEIWTRASQSDDWFALQLKASETGILKDSELTDARKSMTHEQYDQEYECSFEAAILGAYYAREMAEAERAGRIGNVPYDPAARVTTAWDLGIGDSTAIWFCQRVGQETRLIDFYEASGVGLDHYAKVLDGKPYLYADHLLPHDGTVKELGTGRSRVETLAGLGIKATVVPKMGVDDGINAARLLLPRCWFDARKCDSGIEALRQYRTEFDEKRKTFRASPLHDWSSHPADAFRYLAVGIRDAAPNRRRQPDRHTGPGGWMG